MIHFFKKNCPLVFPSLIPILLGREWEENEWGGNHCCSVEQERGKSKKSKKDEEVGSKDDEQEISDTGCPLYSVNKDVGDSCTFRKYCC
jgi:hypothetical protein